MGKIVRDKDKVTVTMNVADVLVDSAWVLLNGNIFKGKMFSVISRLAAKKIEKSAPHMIKDLKETDHIKISGVGNITVEFIKKEI